jgi:2-polyprenyl-3-methyl-5-hydroxy-6-metoxy-1,4-benzoquinol methylase
MSLFIPPKILAMQDDETYTYHRGVKTYTAYNYGGGIASNLKIRHFKVALNATKKYFCRANAIDYGCADGPFLPSLSRYFKSVVGVDQKREFVDLATRLVKEMRLSNVDVICNREMINSQLALKLRERHCEVLFLMEVVEHVGDIDDPYGSKMRFLTELFKLLCNDGVIVLSIPKMFGFSYLMQIVGLRLSGQHLPFPDDKYRIQDILKQGLFINTEKYEKDWHGYHVGFNYKKLETQLNKDFRIIKAEDLIFQKLYIIKQRKHIF